MFILLHIILVMNVRGEPICPWGKYGDACDKNCSEHCRISPSLGIIHCDRASGRCSEGCIPGWYDDTCNKECNTKCIDNICNHGDGACTRGCKDGEKGNFCEREEHERKVNDSTPGPLLWKILVPVCVCLFLLLILMYQYRRGCLRGCENNVERNDYMPVSKRGTWQVSHNTTGFFTRPIANTLLHKASAEGNLVLAKEILNGGILNANTRGSYGLTPLMWAALNGHYYVFEYLKQEGGDMTLKDSDDDSILNMACVGGNMDIVKFVVLREPTLINRQRSDGRTALMWAASRGNTTLFEYLLDRKACPSLDDNDGNNILHHACYGGHIDIVKIVIDQTTLNINTSDLLGRTALMIAATYGHKEVFDLLVGKDSDISHKDKEGNNILHAACRGGHVKMVKHILSQGLVDINSQGPEGKTPLLLAVQWGQGAVFNLLVSGKADLLQVDYNGNNILHLACEIGSMEIVKNVMSQKRLDIKARNIQGETASMVAKRKHHMELYNFLVSKEG